MCFCSLQGLPGRYTSPQFCSSGFWKRASECGTHRRDFFPRTAWMVKLTKSREIFFCFVFHQTEALIDYKNHTHTHTKTKTLHTQNRMFSVLSLLESGAVLPSVSLFLVALAFTIARLQLLLLVADFTKSLAMSSCAC